MTSSFSARMRRNTSSTSKSSSKNSRKQDSSSRNPKCDFFKREIHYLGHLISVDGIHPLPKKLDSICDMPKPRSPKEIKQFLGLTGYYRKFIPQIF